MVLQVERRRRQQRLLAVATIALAATAVALQAMAQGMPAPARSGGVSDPFAIYVEAGADASQIGKMKVLAQEYDTTIKPVYQSFIASVHQMQKLTLEPTLDEEKIVNAQKEINKATSEMNLQKAHLLISFRQVLNDEQKRKLVQILQMRRAGQGTTPGAPKQ